MRAQFIPDTIIYWYAIETLCKLDQGLLESNQTLNLFVIRNCKSNTLQTKSIPMKQYLIA